MSVSLEIHVGDCRKLLKAMPEESVQCVVTSPPYFGLRDYKCEGQIGLEKTWPEFVESLVSVFREVRRVLRNDGTLWLNLGDSYATGAGAVGECPGGGEQGEKWKERGAMTPANRLPQPGLKPKDLMGIPWRVALALQADGWFLRSDIIWHKPNPMPESVGDRPTKAHEYLFLLSKSERYFYDAEAVCEPQQENERTRRLREQTQGLATRYTLARDIPHGQTRPGANGVARSVEARQRLAQKGTRNRRTVWTVPTVPFRGAHFATFPTELVKPCILAGTRPGDTVLDPFGGSGTTGEVSIELGRSAVLLELNPEYAELARSRCSVTPGLAL